MYVKIIADTVISGVHVSASDTPVELDDTTAVVLISALKAEKFIPTADDFGAEEDIEPEEDTEPDH